MLPRNCSMFIQYNSDGITCSQEYGIENGAVFLLLVRPAQLPNVHVALLQHIHSYNAHLFRLLLLDVLKLEVLLPLDWLFLCWPLLAKGGALLAVLELAERVDRLVLHQLFNGGDAFFGLNAQRGQLLQDGCDFKGIVVRFPEIGDDGGEVMVLLLHFLVVAAALLGLPGPDEQLHGLEDLVHPPHVPIHEMVVVDLQEPMILLVLLGRPVPLVYVFHLLRPLPAPPADLDRRRAGRGDLDVGGRGKGVAELEVGVRGLRRRRRREGLIGAEHVFLLLELLLGEQVQSVHWARESLENYIIITLSKVLILPD